MSGNVSFTEIIVDGAGRRIFVLDDVLTTGAVESIHEFLCKMPVTLTDADRPDTIEFKHFKYDFVSPGEQCNEPFANALIDVARGFLEARGIATGPLYRVYLNVNLFGDYQFAHTDGDGWTALLFGNARWGEDWGGEIIFYDEDQDAYSYAISPKPGRMLIFDSTLYHRGGVPSKLFHGARMSVAIKFRKA
jgi:SM-20-related protein